MKDGAHMYHDTGERFPVQFRFNSVRKSPPKRSVSDIHFGFLLFQGCFPLHLHSRKALKRTVKKKASIEARHCDAKTREGSGGSLGKSTRQDKVD